jgi:hypothetical protein
MLQNVILKQTKYLETHLKSIETQKKQNIQFREFASK